MSSRLSLILALVALASWIIIAFVLRVEVGAVHLLLAAGMALAIRWWATRAEAP